MLWLSIMALLGKGHERRETAMCHKMSSSGESLACRAGAGSNGLPRILYDPAYANIRKELAGWLPVTNVENIPVDEKKRRK